MAYYKVDEYNQQALGVTQTYGLRHQGQAFTVSANYDLARFVVVGYRIGSPGTIQVNIYAELDGKPTGEALAATTFNGNELTTDTGGQNINIDFATLLSVVSGTKYVIVISAPDGNVSNMLRIGSRHLEPYYDGGDEVGSTDAGSTWTVLTNYAFPFEIYYFLPDGGISMDFFGQDDDEWNS